MTRLEMSENRQDLNKIIGSIANIYVKFGNITQALEKEVLQDGQFVQLYSQLDSIIKTIGRTVWQTNFYVKHVHLQKTRSHWATFHHQSIP